MADYVKQMIFGDEVHVTFYIDHETPLYIAKEIGRIAPDIEMNGYNWDVLLTCYLEDEMPDVLEYMETDPEAGLYTAYWEDTPENRERAGMLCRLIEDLLESEDPLLDYVRERADEIPWE